MNRADLQAAYASTLVDEWVRCGVTDAVVAPGSRSTPLLEALADDGRMRMHVVLDERAAGFLALGLGRASGRPALVVTTSGTAAVELHPAIVEAHYAGVPLLALTADRPAELQGVGAPQTVAQEALFAGVVRFAAAPGVADEESAGSWRSLAARAVAEAVASPRGPGPVHLNLAFREPLLAADPVAARRLRPEGRPGGAPWHSVAAPALSPPPTDVIEALAAPGQRGVIVAGEGSGDPAAVAELSAATGWPVLADPRSGCRVPGPGTIAASDALLRTTLFANAHPDVVVCLGRPAASKVLGQWLAVPRPGVAQVLVDRYGDWADPHRGATQVVMADPTALCGAVVDRVRAERLRAERVRAERLRAGGLPADGVRNDPLQADRLRADGLPADGVRADPLQADRLPAGGPPTPAAATWALLWERGETVAQRVMTEFLEGPDLSEPAIARAVLGALADGTTLITASSMPVRDVEWWGQARHGVRVLSNRGANGIDGTVATALGVALAEPQCPVVAVLGDLAFLYDAGALLWAPRRLVDLTLVVVDNNGGGIFSFLPQATALPPARFESLWTTPHDTDLGALASAYGVAITEVHTIPELRHELTTRAPGTPSRAGPSGRAGTSGRAHASGRAGAPGVRVVLARTDRAANVKIHAALNEAIAGAIAAELGPTPDGLA